MGRVHVTAVIYNCDTPGCNGKSKALHYPEDLPQGWVEEHGFTICIGCVYKRPCGHFDGAVAKSNCDICKDKCCPDCLLQFSQQSIWYSKGGYGLPLGEPLEVTGHLAKCEWVKKRYPTAFKKKV